MNTKSKWNGSNLELRTLHNFFQEYKLHKAMQASVFVLIHVLCSTYAVRRN